MFRIFFIVWRGGLLKNGGFLLIIFIIIILRDYMLIYKDYLVENKYWKFKEKILYISIYVYIFKYKY